MTRERSFVRMATGPVIALLGLLVGAPAGSAADQGIFLDLTHALQNATEMSTRRSLSPTNPEVLTRKSTDFMLLGVVIAGETRLALVQLTSSAGGPELLSIGGSLEGYRLIDVEENQVTLEGQRGERMILRRQIGGGAGGEIALSGGTGRVETPQSTGPSEFDRPESIRAKEDRSLRRAERDAQQKVRDLAQRAASGQPGQPPSEPEQ